MASITAEAANSSSDVHTALAGPHPDPYAIAYLRGGSRELLKLRLFDLMQMGYLMVVERKRWTRIELLLTLATDAPEWRMLAEPDRYWLEFLKWPRTPKEILELRFLPELESACRQYRQELWQEGLLTGRLTPESAIYKGFARATVPALFVTFILSAIANMPLIFFAALAIAVVIGLVLTFGLSYRPSEQGRLYLKDLRRRYASYVKFDSSTWDLTPHAARLAVVAVFGVEILFASPADALAAFFDAKNSKGGAEYGVSNGGGSCGGCGGCGGCGD